VSNLGWRDFTNLQDFVNLSPHRSSAMAPYFASTFAKFAYSLILQTNSPHEHFQRSMGAKEAVIKW